MIDEYMEIAKVWATNQYFEKADREEIQQLLEQNNKSEITERFYRDLEFGTGGLRAILGMGRNRMNRYAVRRATQALATTIKKFFPNTATSELKVAISYDNRRFSQEFAKECACVLAGNDIQSFIFDHLNPTPLLSYSVRYHQAQAGIMITASHNPPNYNGYKAYWSDGAQILSPYDKEIINCYENLTDFNQIKYLNFEQALTQNLIHWTAKEVEDSYHRLLRQAAFRAQMCQEHGQKLKVVFTPLHGTGFGPCVRALKELGFSQVLPVPEQSKPDSEFSTVSSPNPENPEALKMAVDLMKKENADIACATDPDADRLGVVVNHHGKPYYLNGNQTGVLLLHFALSSLKEKNMLPKNALAIKTIVTSELQTKIASHFEVKMENTLTGFKWICARMRKIEEENLDETFVFANEESFGYLPHAFVRDKDGVASVAMMAEAALYYKLQNKNLVEALDDIYLEYGFHYESLLSVNYEGKEGEQKIKRIMEFFRKTDSDRFSEEKITSLEDYQKGIKKNFLTQEEIPLNIPQSNVLGMTFESQNKLYLRPSGTEPKIKFYIMVQENSGSLEEKKSQALKKCQQLEDYIKLQLLDI